MDEEKFYTHMEIPGRLDVSRLAAVQIAKTRNPSHPGYEIIIVVQLVWDLVNPDHCLTCEI